MLSFVLFTIVVLVALRWYALRVERGAGEPADKMHRIQRAFLLAVFGLLVMTPLILVELRAEGISQRGAGAPISLLTIMAVFVAFLGYMVAVYLVVYPSTAPLRGLQTDSKRAGARLGRLIGVLFLPQLGWLVVFMALAPLIRNHSWVLWVALLAWVLFVAASAPHLVRAMMKTKPLDPELRRGDVATWRNKTGDYPRSHRAAARPTNARWRSGRR